MDDKLIRLREFYQEKVKQKEFELATLTSKLKVIDELVEESKSLRICEDLIHLSTLDWETGNDAEKRIVSDAPGSGKYQSMWLTPAVVDALKEHSGGATVKAIREYLLKHGFRPQGSNFHSSVGTALKRLVEAKKAMKVDGPRPLYFPKNLAESSAHQEQPQQKDES